MTRIALIQQQASADKRANVELGVRALETAAANGAELVCFPELAFEPFYPQHRAGARVRTPCGAGAWTNYRYVPREPGKSASSCSTCSSATASTATTPRRCSTPTGPCFHEQDCAPRETPALPYIARAIGRVGAAICYDRHFPEYMWCWPWVVRTWC